MVATYYWLGFFVRDTASDDDEVLNALSSVVQGLKKNAGILLIASMIGGILFVIVALVSAPYYTATTTLVASSAVAQSGQTNSTLNTLSSLTGAMSGVTKELSPFERLQLVLKSTGMAKAVLSDEKAREILFPDRWDPVSHTWSEPSGILARIKSLIGRGESAEPDSITAARALEKHLSLSTDATDGSVRLTFTARDRDAALFMLRLVLEKADDIVRRDYLVVAQGYTDYILKLLPTVDNVVSRSALTDQMSRYQETVVMAHVNLPFAELAIDPPTVPLQRSGPMPLIYLSIGMAFGFVSGIVYLLIRPRFLRDRDRVGGMGFPAGRARSGAAGELN